MIKIDLKKAFVPLNPERGKKKTILSDVISDWLAQDTKGDRLKFWQWAIDFNKKGCVEVDESDFKTLYDWIDAHPSFTAALAAQCMLEMNEQKKK